MKKRWIYGITLSSMLFSCATFAAEPWSHWRGPNYNGSSDATDLPSSWSKEENVKWVTPMPGESAATPVVWGDKIFVSSVDSKTGSLVALCLNRGNGEILWKKDIGHDLGNWRRQNRASPSPVTDGKQVFFMYGTGDLAALDMDGNIQWKRNLEEDFGKIEIQFGYASSPTIYNGKLYIVILQRNKDSFLLAVNPATGEDLWKQVRETDAQQESQEAYTTPIPFEHNGRKEILVFGADYATGHDADTGEELWRWGNYNPRKIGHYRIVPSAVSGGDHIFVAGPKREPLFAIQAGKQGNLSDDAISWKYTEFPPDVCVPMFMNGKLYVFDGDKYVMTCLDPKTGDVAWTGEPGGRTVYRASPTGADGKIYIINEDGLVVVMQEGSEYKELSRIEMGEAPCRSSIALADGQILIRTAQNLYCIGK